MPELSIELLPQQPELQVEAGRKKTYFQHPLASKDGLKPQQPQLITALPQPVTITVGEGAELTVYSLFSAHEPQQRTITISRDAKVSWVDIVIGNQELHSAVFLRGPGAQVEQRQLFLGSSKEKPSISTTISHEASYTNSTILAKGILEGNAIGKVHGTILVKSEAAGCNAQEKMNILLLSTEARCDALPILDVANDDVQASHGAAISHLDESHLFYLQSRGISEHIARKLIIEGFMDAILAAIPEEIKEKVLALIRERGNV